MLNTFLLTHGIYATYCTAWTVVTSVSSCISFSVFVKLISLCPDENSFNLSIAQLQRGEKKEKKMRFGTC